jgi:rod shape-determining protein MreC
MIPAERTSQVSVGTVSALASVQKRLARFGRLLGDSFDLLGSLRGSASEQNRALKEKVIRLTEQRDLWHARANESEQKLKMLGEFRRYQQDRRPNEADEVAEAEIIGQGSGAQRGLVFIDRGSRDGLAKGTAVAAGRSIAGRVSATSTSTSSVLLITSPASKIDGRIKLTGERGIVVGNGDGTMRMTYISKVKPRTGDSVMTVGLDGTTPKHFVLGTIVSVGRRPGQLAYEVTLKPLRQLDRLVNVVVVRPAVSPGDQSAPTRDGADTDG